jgi:hypothetical protein
MTFADKCKLLGKRRGQNAAPAARDNKLRAALLPGRRRELALSDRGDVPVPKP